MRKSNLIALALSIVLTALSATAQKTAYGYTMMPTTSPALYSFNLSDLTTTTKLGTYSKADPRSGAAVKGTLYMMGVDDDFNVWFYSMNLSTGESETIEKLGDITIPTDMAYDYTTETMYSIANSESVDGVSALSTVDLSTGKITSVCENLGASCKAIAIDARGQMYMLTNTGYLLKVNKSTGENNVLGHTGVQMATWWNFQSMEFDRETGVLYLAAWTKDEKTVLYTVDTTNGKATQMGTIGNGNHMIALTIPYEPAAGTAPDRVSGLRLEPDQGGALHGTLYWTNPVNDYSGSPLTGALTIEVVNTVTGEKVVLEDCRPDEAMELPVEVGEAGMYGFTVTAANDFGASLEQMAEGWIGHDVPGAPTDAKATLDKTQLLVNDITWTAPATGAHGGFLDKNSLTYDVVRLNDGLVVAEGLTATSFRDIKLPEELARYNYQITAKNADGMGESAKTNDLVNGTALDCPYVAPFNSWEESGQFWTVLDANEDGYPFVWYKDYMNMFGQGYDKCYFIYQPNEVFYGFDFIISPPINFTEGHEYKVTATVSNDDIAGYREESFRFYTMAGYDLNGAVPLGNEAYTVKHPGEFRDYSITFTVEDDGYGSADETFPSFIALCCTSHYDMGMLLVSQMAIEDITPAQHQRGDVNGDGEVNIADVNALIDMILKGEASDNADVNSDGEVNIADVNNLIDLILTM